MQFIVSILFFEFSWTRTEVCLE